MRWAPAGLIVFLTVLAMVGGHLRAYELTANTRCNYVLAEQSLPSADVVIIGSSRVMHGLDPDYIQAVLAEDKTGASVERVALSWPNFAQFYPPLNRYIETRGAPKLVYLQLAYNYYADRQDTFDLPLNPQRNVAFGRLSELIAVQHGAPLNDTGTRLPRQLHKLWESMAAVWLTHIEMSVFSALRYVPKKLNKTMPACTGDFLRANGNDVSAIGLTVAEAASVEFTSMNPTTLKTARDTVEAFLPMAPSAGWRRGETAQLTRLVALLQGAGTDVVFLIMPSIDQRAVDPDILAEIKTVFPSIDVFFPMDEYGGELAEQISTSFKDAIHSNDFGTVHLSRALAADLQQRLVKQ